jgi:hypothetical protein
MRYLWGVALLSSLLFSCATPKMEIYGIASARGDFTLAAENRMENFTSVPSDKKMMWGIAFDKEDTVDSVHIQYNGLSIIPYYVQNAKNGCGLGMNFKYFNAGEHSFSIPLQALKFSTKSKERVVGVSGTSRVHRTLIDVGERQALSASIKESDPYTPGKGWESIEPTEEIAIAPGELLYVLLSFSDCPHEKTGTVALEVNDLSAQEGVTFFLDLKYEMTRGQNVM